MTIVINKKCPIFARLYGIIHININNNYFQLGGVLLIHYISFQQWIHLISATSLINADIYKLFEGEIVTSEKIFFNHLRMKWYKRYAFHCFSFRFYNSRDQSLHRVSGKEQLMLFNVKLSLFLLINPYSGYEKHIVLIL